MQSSPPAVEETRFDSGGTFCAASVHRPAGPGLHPVVVMGHGLGSVRTMRMPAYAERFVAAGYACVLFDYRYFGDSGGEPRRAPRHRQPVGGLGFGRRVRQVAPRHRPGPGRRVGHVVRWRPRARHRCEDPRIAAVIAQCPFVDGFASAGSANPVSAAKVTALAFRDMAGQRLGRPPVMVASAGHPGDAALMVAPDCYDGYLNLVPDGARFENRVAARFAWHITTHRPIKEVPKIKAPVLYAICETDSVAPAAAAQKAAAATPNGEAKLYALGHFDIYVGDGFDQTIEDQVGFLQRHVPVEGAVA